MGKLLAGALIGGLVLFIYQHATRDPPASQPLPLATENPYSEELPAVERDTSRFRCDGRVYCSQMTSCEEATFFLENCPGVKMDGEGDGVPCEKQWCGSH
jgi:excalibur calcium-binding domain-containing protein